jgi:4-diphosphocytidyl-2C-methyl-D-erythritol kinase
LAEMYYQDPSSWNFYNSFYEVTKKDFPVLENIRRLCEKHGSSYVTMTGSGSVMVALFSKTEFLRLAAREFESGGMVTHEAFLLARNEDVILK